MTDIPAICVHADGTEHPAPNGIIWDASQQRWITMYTNCPWAGSRINIATGGGTDA